MYLSLAVILPVLATLGAAQTDPFKINVITYTDAACTKAGADPLPLTSESCVALPKPGRSYTFKANKKAVNRPCRVTFFSNDNCSGRFTPDIPASDQGTCYSKSSIGFIPKSVIKSCGLG